MAKNLINIETWNNESYVDDWAFKKLEGIGLKKYRDFHTQTDMSDYMKEALKGSSKTYKKNWIWQT